jgi:hypothetical protein
MTPGDGELAATPVVERLRAELQAPQSLPLPAPALGVPPAVDAPTARLTTPSTGPIWTALRSVMRRAIRPTGSAGPTAPAPGGAATPEVAGATRTPEATEETGTPEVTDGRAPDWDDVPPEGLVLIVGTSPDATEAGERLARVAGIPVAGPDVAHPSAVGPSTPAGAMGRLEQVTARLGDALDLGGDAPPVLDPEWPDRPDLAGLRREAAEALALALASAPTVAWVDGWSWLTAPFWAGLGLPVTVVVVWSGPEEGSKAIARRHGTDLAGGLAWWEAAARTVLDGLPALPGFITSVPDTGASEPPEATEPTGPAGPGQVAPGEPHLQLTTRLADLTGSHPCLPRVDLPVSSGWGPALLSARRAAREAAADAARARASIAPAQHEVQMAARALRWLADAGATAPGTARVDGPDATGRIDAAEDADVPEVHPAAPGGDPAWDAWATPAPVVSTSTESWAATERGAATESGASATVSVLVAVAGADTDALARTVGSLRSQAGTSWQLLLCAARDDQAGRRAVTTLAGADPGDPRVGLAPSPETDGLPAALQAGVSAADGEWLTVVDLGDELAPTGLGEMLAAVGGNPGIDLVYSDEVLLDRSGKPLGPRPKPGWSPTLLLGAAYLGRAWMARATAVERVGGIREGPAWEYDLMLRLGQDTAGVVHVRRALHRRRVRELSPPPNAPAPLPARRWDAATTAAAREVLDAEIRRRDPRATIHDGPMPTTARLGRPLSRPPRIAVVMVLGTDATRLQRSTDGLGPVSGVPDVTVTLLDRSGTDVPASSDPEVDALVEELVTRPGWRRLTSAPGSLTAARLAAAGSGDSTSGDSTSAEMTLFVDPDLDLTVGGWLRTLVEELLRPGVGVVGPRLAGPDGRVVSQGITFGPGPVVAPRGGGSAKSDHGWTALASDCLAVNGCLLTWTALVGELGLDGDAGDAWADVDYCLRLVSHGWRVVATPAVTLRWTRPVAGPGDRPPGDGLRRRWATLFSGDDPVDPGWLPGRP